MDWLRTFRAATKESRKKAIAMFRKPASRKAVGTGAGGDLTLKIDQVSEHAILRSLKQKISGSFEFLGEEVGEKKFGSNARYLIVCDPIDGSHNAKIGLPLFGVSFAVLEMGRTFSNNVFGYVENLTNGDFFYAWKGKGSFRNGSRLFLQKKKIFEGKKATIDTLGIEISSAMYLKEVLSKISDVNKVRILGSAAISMCYLADGTFDGFIFASPNGSRTLDSVAAYRIASEAGAVLTNENGNTLDDLEIGLNSRTNIVGGVTAEVHGKLLEMLRTN